MMSSEVMCHVYIDSTIASMKKNLKKIRLSYDQYGHDFKYYIK